MHFTRRELFAAGAFVAVSATLAGCSAGTPSTSPSGTASGSAQKASTKNAVFAQSVQVTSLAPMGKQPQVYPAGYEAAFAIYSGLVKMSRDMTFQPDLAEKWTTSSDGLSWTFTLRKGVTFHDGSSFTADDVVAYFTRMLDPNYNLSALSLWSPISKVTSSDPTTVTITTAKPYSAMLNTLAHGSGLIPSAKLTQAGESDAALHAVGTGPYKLKSFNPGTSLVVEANKSYYGPAPTYDEITYQYVPDPTGRLSALQAGQANIVDAVPVAQADSVKTSPNTHLVSFQGLQTFGIGMNLSNPQLADPAVRKALNLAIDVDAIVKTVMRGYATPLNSPLANNTVGHVKVGEPSYSKSKAISMLKKAGYTAGSDGKLSKDGTPFSLRFITPNGLYVNDVLVAQAVQAQLQDIGIDVTLSQIDKSSYNAKLQGSKAAADFDLAMFGFNPSHGSGVLQLSIMFASNPSEARVPGWNYMWYSNPKVDQLISDGLSTVQSDQQKKVMTELQQTLWDDSPYLWLYSIDVLVAYDSKVATPEVLPVGFVLPSRAA